MHKAVAQAFGLDTNHPDAQKLMRGERPPGMEIPEEVRAVRELLYTLESWGIPKGSVIRLHNHYFDAVRKCLEKEAMDAYPRTFTPPSPRMEFEGWVVMRMLHGDGYGVPKELLGIPNFQVEGLSSDEEVREMIEHAKKSLPPCYEI